MSAKEDAARFDAADRPVEATQAYEIALTEPDADLETYLNLAVLSFECTDFGYLAHHHLSDDFVHKAWRRALEVLDDADGFFGRQAEVEFWRRYFRYVRLGDEPFVEDCEQLVRSGMSLVPYFFLFISSGRKLYREEAQRLFESVRAGTTARERYIRSILGRLPKRPGADWELDFTDKSLGHGG